MSHPKYTKSKTVELFTSPASAITFKFAFAGLILALATPSYAAWKNEDPVNAYVDSVHQWGAWELDIEPAAGGLTPPSTGALNARDAKVRVRTNSISALAPSAPPSPVVFNTPTPVVPTVVPAAPVTPPPPVTPPRPAPPTNFAPPPAKPPTVVTLPSSLR